MSGGGNGIDPDLPPGRLKLAHRLTDLRALMPTLSLTDIAELLKQRDYAKDSTEISRYLNGRRLPPANFVEAFYRLVAAQTGESTPLGMKLTDVISVHGGAEARPCKQCASLRTGNRSLLEENRSLQEENLSLADALARSPRPEAGLPVAPPAASGPPAHLPVPSTEVDRQRTARDIMAAQQAAARASALYDRGEPGAALSALRESAEVLSPLESAASMALLRHQDQNDLADTLIQIYGRDQTSHNTMTVAAWLIDYGLPEDAGAILRAAGG